LVNLIFFHPSEADFIISMSIALAIRRHDRCFLQQYSLGLSDPKAKDQCHCSPSGAHPDDFCQVRNGSEQHAGRPLRSVPVGVSKHIHEDLARETRVVSFWTSLLEAVNSSSRSPTFFTSLTAEGTSRREGRTNYGTRKKNRWRYIDMYAKVVVL